MKFAVIGATGYVGNAVVQELAARGHDVTAFARNTGKVFAAPNVRAVAADVTAADFATQLAGFDGVVSAFNPGWTNPNIGRDFRAGYAAILAARGDGGLDLPGVNEALRADLLTQQTTQKS